MLKKLIFWIFITAVAIEFAHATKEELNPKSDVPTSSVSNRDDSRNELPSKIVIKEIPKGGLKGGSKKTGCCVELKQNCNNFWESIYCFCCPWCAIAGFVIKEYSR